jgi:hypothetical protein
MNSQETFFTAIGCIDGRCGEAVLLYGQERFGARYADMITEESMAIMLTQSDLTPQFSANLKKKIDMSLIGHKSKGIVVYGHEDCFANLDDEAQKDSILYAVEIIQGIIDDPNIPVIGLFVEKIGNDLQDYEAFEITEPEDYKN